MPNNTARPIATKLGVEFLEARTVPAVFAPTQGETVAVGDVIPGNSFTPGGTNYDYVTGSGPGVQATVKVYDANGTLRYTLQPFANYTGGVNVAVADVTHTLTSVAGVSSASMAADGTVTVNTTINHGYTVGQTVKISNVAAFDAMGNFVYSYDGTYTITAVDGPFSFQFITYPPLMLPPTAFGGSAGVYQKDLIVSTAAGTTGRVRVYSFEANTLRSVSLFQPFGPNYVGGVELTTGDVSGDFTKEIIVGQQTNGSIVKVFAVDPNSGGHTYFQTRRFVAFEPGYTGGVTIASANIDATENNSNYNYDYSEILVGKAKNAPLLKIFDAQKPTVTVRAQYFVFTPNVPDVNVGINVAAGNTDGLRGAEIYVSLMNTTNVRIFNGQTGTTISEFTVPYPTGYGRNLDISINDLCDVLAPDSSPVSDAFLATNLFVVASDGPNAQIPLIFPGMYFSPAGMNGFHAAP